MQYVVEGHPVRLIALDTLVPGQVGGLLCAERLIWLAARLEEAPARPTLIFMHHPPFVTGLQAMDAMGLEGKEELAAVIRRHPQVERLVCGHVHRPMTRHDHTGHARALRRSQQRAQVRNRPRCRRDCVQSRAPAGRRHLPEHQSQ